MAAHRDRLRVSVLEAREVPAVFYVDPLFAGVANGTTVTFNEFSPNPIAGRTVGTDAFATLNAALTAAAANAEADTIFLARSRFDFDGAPATGSDLVPNTTPLNNSAGPIVINDNITLIGSGIGATILSPTNDTTAGNVGVFLVPAGKRLAISDLTLDGTGRQIGVGIRYDGAGSKGELNRVAVTNTDFAPIFGTGVLAINGANVTVTDSKFSGYGRIGVSFADSTGSVTNSVIMGSGAGTDFVNYGVQLSGSSAVNITGNTISNNTASTPAIDLSAGVNMFEVAGAAPTATLTKNTITGNIFGVLVGGEFGVDQSKASIRSNNLNGNYIAIQPNNKANVDPAFVVDAVNNWYGDASGPYVMGANVGGKGAEVTDGVTFTPWLTKAFVETVTETVIVEVPPPPPQPIVPPPPAGLVAGGSGQLVALDASLASVLNARPFGLGYTGEVRVARGDVNGDGAADFIASAGEGGGPRVLVFDGKSGAIIRDFFAYRQDFMGGVFVAAGDIDGDGSADIVTGAGGGGGTHVRAFSGQNGAELRSFFVYDRAYIGGVTVAAGDVNGDGFADIIAGTTVGGGPNVRVFDGASGEMTRSFFAYSDRFTGGVFVAAGDLNADGFSEIITGSGIGGGANVRVFDGQTNSIRNSFTAGNAAAGLAVRVGAQDLDNDGQADLLLAQGPGGDNRVQVIYAANLAKGNLTPTAFTGSLFGSNGGLNVG